MTDNPETMHNRKVTFSLYIPYKLSMKHDTYRIKTVDEVLWSKTSLSGCTYTVPDEHTLVIFSLTCTSTGKSHFKYTCAHDIAKNDNKVTYTKVHLQHSLVSEHTAKEVYLAYRNSLVYGSYKPCQEWRTLINNWFKLQLNRGVQCKVFDNWLLDTFLDDLMNLNPEQATKAFLLALNKRIDSAGVFDKPSLARALFNQDVKVLCKRCMDEEGVPLEYIPFKNIHITGHMGV